MKSFLIKSNPAPSPVLLAVGIICSQTWIPAVVALIECYKSNETLLTNMAYLSLSYLLAFAAIAAAVTFSSIHKQSYNYISYGVAAFSCTVVGIGILSILRQLDQPSLKLMSTIAGALLGASGSLLLFGWVRSYKNYDRQHLRQAFTGGLFLVSFIPILIQQKTEPTLWLLVTMALCGMSSLLLIIVNRPKRQSLQQSTADSNSDQNEELSRVEPPANITKQGLTNCRLRLVFSFACFGLALGSMLLSLLVAQHGRAPWPTNWFAPLGVLVSVLLIEIIRLTKKDTSALSAYRFACIPVLIALFPPLDVLNEFSLQYSFCLSVFALWMTTEFCGEVSFESADIFECSWLPLFAATTLGLALGLIAAYGSAMLFHAWDWHVSVLSSLATILYIALTIIASNVVVSRSTFIALRKQHHLSPESVSKNDNYALQDAVSEISKRYTLTDRETEVLAILVRGYGISKVQTELFVSEGTAITHRNHIYRKLDVHSKSELLELVERIRSTDDA